jgi:hypothetical protein
LKGQWIGNYLGTSSGQIIIEIDELKDCFEGVAYLYDDNKNLPGSFVVFKTADKSTDFSLCLNVHPLDRGTGNVSDWSRVQSQHPDADFPTTVYTQLKLLENSLDVQWTTSIGSNGNASVPRSSSQKKSEIVAEEIRTWKEFKDYATKLDPYRFMFRGQENSCWRLRTHFHRTGRANLMGFMERDIPALHKNLSHLTTHVFNLANPIENGAFFALAQHHGYPTPLLDWTLSPFIAVYFAYNDLAKEKRNDGHSVRIFVFDRKQWSEDFNQLQKLTPARPHFSILDALALNNPRMVPQQALASVTNVDDIESYIRNREQDNQKTYLQVIDLPASGRKEIMQELSLMGITAGSLFPGLDGVCKQLKERFFDL